MAARIRKYHTDEIRAKIQASQLINRLQDHALGEIEMSASQIRAAEIVLKKSVPDLSSMELTGEGGGPVQIAASELSDDDLAKIAAQPK